MASFLIVMASVLVLGRITAEHLAAGLADPQMHPSPVDQQAFLAAERRIVRLWDQVF